MIRLVKFNEFVESLDPENRDDWISAAGKANQLWHGSNIGLENFNKWSSLAPNYKGLEDVAYHYRSLGNHNKSRPKSSGLVENSKSNKQAIRLFSKASAIDPNHPYLTKKLALPHGIKQFQCELCIPLRTMDGILSSLQFINSDGEKRFLSGGKVKACFFLIHGKDKSNYFFCEGFATGSAVAQATDSPVVVTFNSNNLQLVPGIFRKRLPRHNFYIAADDDVRPNTSMNIGINAALEAARHSRAQVICPKSKNKKRTKQDFADVLIRDGLQWLKESIMEQVT